MGFKSILGTKRVIIFAMFLSFAPVFISSTFAATDTDGDGVNDSSDNCIQVHNPLQRDTDFDNYGNFCDPDFDNNLIVNAADLAFFKTKFFSTDPDADLNGSDIVNAADLAILKTMFFQPPGPSGVAETTTFTIDAIANVAVKENSAYTSVTPTIIGTPIGAVTYALGGTDAALFTIDSTTGVVSMIARDFEAPVDANTDNIYNLNITVTDTDGNSDIEAWNVTVVDVADNPVNSIPVANDDNVTTTVDTTFFFNVLANDTDIDGDVLSVSLPTPNTAPANGLVSYNGSGTFTYAPNTGFIGTDSFTYTVTDSIDSAVGTVTITVTPPGTPIDMVTLMSAVEGGVAGIENAEANVYAYWTDNYNLANSVFLPEDNVYNHLSGAFASVVNNGDLLLSGSQWVSEGDIIGIDDNNGGLDLTILDANNVNVEVARFNLTAHFQDLSNVRITDYLNTEWQLAMVNQNATFNVGAKLITDYRFEALVESHILGQDNSCQKDGTTKFTDLNGNCNSVDVDAVINATGYAQLLSDVVATTVWVDPSDFSTPPGAITIATNNLTNKTLMVQLVSGGAANYYVVDWNSSSAFAFVANAVAGANWVQNTGSGVDMIHFQVPASFITQFSDDLGNGLNNFLTVQNGYVRQGLKHAIGDTQFSDGQFNGNAFTDILANFSAPVIPGLAELTGTWINSVASANGDPALIHIFANGNYESSGSCDLDGSTGMEYGTVSSSGAVTNIIAHAQIATQGLCGPSQGNKTLTVNGDVLTLSEPGFPDIVYSRLVGTLNPTVGSWLLGNIQDPGEAHTILTVLDDTTFTLSQDCTTESVSGFEYGAYAVDQSNNLTGTLTIDSNGGCGLHNNTALSISGFTMTVVGDTLTLTDTVGGGGVFTFARVSPAYVIPMLQVVYTLDNIMMQPGDGQITGSFTWSYVDGDFAGGSGQFTDLTIPGYGSDIAGLNINFDSQVGIEITLLVNTNNNGVDIIFNFLQPLSPTVGSGINLGTSSYNIEIGALQGAFVSGAFTPQLAP